MDDTHQGVMTMTVCAQLNAPRITIGVFPTVFSLCDKFLFDCHQRDEMYFSRRICGIGKPNSFKALKPASTMLGLPQR